jgi:hypothetical protein
MELNRNGKWKLNFITSSGLLVIGFKRWKSMQG